jgi:hypothetical protein
MRRRRRAELLVVEVVADLGGRLRALALGEEAGAVGASVAPADEVPGAACAT